MEVFTPRDYRDKTRKRPRRSLRPCDACRKRKSRCVTGDNGEQGCVHCQLKGTPCTFARAPPSRNPTAYSANGHSHSLPGQVGLNPGNDILPISRLGDSEPQGSSVATVNKSQSRDGEQSQVFSTNQSPVHTRPDLTLGLVGDRFAELYGLGSDMEPILMRNRPYDARTHEFSLETHAIRQVLEKDDGQEYPLTFHMAADVKAIGGDPADTQLNAIEECVMPHGPRLVELFWRHVQPCYPILAKEIFMSQYNQYRRSIPAALLGAVYLSSLRWWGYDPELSIRDPVDAGLLRRLTVQAIPTSYHCPKLSSIQATLLLLQCQPEDPLNPDHTADWGLTCQALAIGQCIGLHLDASNWAIPQWERNLRKRLSWALYMQDRWTALAYGRPVHIHEDDWTVQDLNNSDFTDYEVPRDSLGHDEDRRSIIATGKLQYMQMVQLSKILSSVLSTFYTLRSSHEQDTVVLYEKARPLFDALTGWYQGIPACLHMNITYQRKLCFHGYLHFSYYGVAITLLRRLIRSTALPPRCADERTLTDIRQYALQTAQDAIGFVTNLRPDHLEAFWYFTSPYLFSLVGSFTTLLLVTSLSSQERNFWQETLNSYLWALRTRSKCSEPMQYAVNRLEGAILRGLEHALAVNLNEPVDEDVSPLMANHISDVYEFTDFGDWDLAGNEAFDLLGAMAMSPSGLILRENLG